MTNITYSPRAREELLRLSQSIQQRIVKKIRWFAGQENPLNFAKRLSGPLAGCWRFRIGEYRIIFDYFDDNVTIIHVLSVRHRSSVYRDVL